MANFRSKYFEGIEEIYRDIESLGKLCNLSEIKRKISSLFNYSASNDKFTDFINFTVNRLNAIINFSVKEWLKPKLMELYNKLVNLLPADLQLELPLDVVITEPLKKVRRRSKVVEQLIYMWKQLTLSDISFFPQIGITAWEKGWRKV